MPKSLQSKGDGEYPFSAPFSGLNVSVPSILLPSNAQDIQTSPSFSVVRGSLCAPWPYATSLLGYEFGAGEYLLFVTPSGYLFTNLNIYRFSTESDVWFVQKLVSMPNGAFSAASATVPDTQTVPFVESNGGVFFSCLLGIYRFDTASFAVSLWGVVSASSTSAPFYAQFLNIFEQRMVAVGTYVTSTTPTPNPIPLSPLVIAWSVVSDFSVSSVGSFNVNPDVDDGVVGGYDVLTSYSQGTPVGMILVGHSLYVIMSQGIVEMDPSASGTSAFTFYNWWQENIPVGAIPGTVAQWGEFGAFITPDNVILFTPGGNQAVGTQISAYVRYLLKRNSALVSAVGGIFGDIATPANGFFYTMYGELHYAVNFYFLGVPPQQKTVPYPAPAENSYYSLILDYNMASGAWSQCVYPAFVTPLYQIIGPPQNLNIGTITVPQQSLLIGGSLSNDVPGMLVLCGDSYPKWFGGTPESSYCSPLKAQVGFPQSPISSGHRPTTRRVRIEYSWDELSSLGAAASVSLAVTIQGTVTNNIAAVNEPPNFVSSLQSASTIITISPLGNGDPANGPLDAFLTSTAYADIPISCENPQVSLSWTDPSATERLMIHRVTLMVNDTQGTLQ